MSDDLATVSVVIDNTRYAVPRGATVLEAARAQGIYIPTLCAHESLTPYGGCRMCIVEVDGFRNFPTACTTPVAEGMVVRTDTAQLQAMRIDILQLLMSEHTSSCLVCGEKDECRRYSTTIRKVGITTGCRFCAKDGQCEFQEVAERLGVRTIDYPVHYRGMRVEDEDPFYDRDHNLCILCGRCVRVCQEVRVADVLGFKYRGRRAVVGPAFERTHVEAGCEFCGACVAVCPTGALAEKARKWEGKPDREVHTTCPYCGVGCRMRLRVREDRMIGTLPDADPAGGEGQLCVRGRFCVSEVVNEPRRLRRPSRGAGSIAAEITWDEAIARAAERLAACAPGTFRMLVSPCLTNEDLYVAQKFARVALGTNDIDCTARTAYGSGFPAYLDLLRGGATLADVRRASAILCVGLDTRFGRSVVGVELRRAARQGRKVVTLHARPHNLTRIAERWLRPAPGGELALLRDLLAAVASPGTGGASPAGDVAAAAAILRGAEAPAILLGSELLPYDRSAELLQTLADLARRLGARIVPLPAQNNLRGTLEMGAYAGLLPGGAAVADAAARSRLERLWGVPPPAAVSGWNAGNPAAGARGVLYLVGETLPPELRATSDHVIYQNIYPLPFSRPADLALPAAAFTEVDGSCIHADGRVLRVRPAVAPPAEALPDWEILCRVARRMGKSGFEFADAAAVRAEIARVVEGFPAGGESDAPRPYRGAGAVSVPPAAAPAAEAGPRPFVLTAAALEHVHRGFPLTTWVEGAERLFPAGVAALHPRDAAAAGLSEGDEIAVEAPDLRGVWRVRIDPEQPAGALHVTLRHGERLSRNPCRVEVRKCHV